MSAALLLLYLSGISAAQENRPSPDRPNIVLIVADDLGWNCVGYHSNLVKTPQIDRLADQGVILDRFYVSPMCSPTRAGIMTGRYPMRYGMARSVVRPWARYGLPPDEHTLPELLAAAGYRHRGVFGKWHLGHLEPKWHPLSQGFTEFKGQYNGAADYWTRDRMGEIDWHINDTPHDEQGYTTDLITEAACRFIRTHAGQEPFFCYVPFTAPHDPFQAPENYINRYKHLDDDPDDGKPSATQSLAAMITCMDDGIGRIMAALRETGLAENTLVWFLSDNGGVLRLRETNIPLREGKLTVYEGGVRVPSVVWWPGVVEGGRTITEPLINLDILPTLARIAGANVPPEAELDGRNVLDVLAGRTASLPPRDLYLFNGQSGLEKEQIAVISADGWKLVVIGPDIRRPEGFQTAAHRVELFHLAKDPYEKHDLSSDQPDRVAELGRKLVAFRRLDPPDSLAPSNRPPRRFKPPPHWRNRRPAAETQPQASSARRPNLVFVFADQLRYPSCGYAGDPDARTPHMDTLASQSVNFMNAISGHPVCAPYRASLFTGKYTTSTGMVINELRMNPNHECIGHVLTRYNYQTAYIGKWHLWAAELGNHYDPKNSFIPPGPYRLGFDGFWAAYNFHHEYYKGYYHTNSPEKIPFEGYEPDAQTDMAIDLINRYSGQDQPFALFLSIGTPHDPWRVDNVPPEYYAMFADEGDTPRFTLPPNYKPENDPYSDNWGKFKGPRERASLPRMMRVYYAMIANLDWNLGRLIRAIDEAGIRDNTIVVFTSDHGEMMGAHGRRAKNIFYEEAIRVPFLIRWPGKVPTGHKSDACLNTPDIMPTLLGMAGLPIPAKVEGMDLSHAAFGRTGPEPEAAFMQNTGACAIWEDGYEWRALRDKRYTYAIYRKDRKEFLFDNRSDPFQLENLAERTDHQEMLNRFRALLAARMKAIDDTFEASSFYRDNWTRDRIITRVR